MRGVVEREKYRCLKMEEMTVEEPLSTDDHWLEQILDPMYRKQGIQSSTIQNKICPPDKVRYGQYGEQRQVHHDNLDKRRLRFILDKELQCPA